MSNDTNSMKVLLAKWKGDSVLDEGDTIGTTALHTAASHGNMECVKLLLDAGASKAVKNHYGQTPYSKCNNAEIKALVKISGYNKNNVNNQEGWCSIS